MMQHPPASGGAVHSSSMDQQHQPQQQYSASQPQPTASTLQEEEEEDRSLWRGELQNWRDKVEEKEVRTLWIGNLQHLMDEDYIDSCFSHTGEVFTSKVIHNGNSSDGSYGFIEFKSRAIAERILLQFDGIPMPRVAPGTNFTLKWASSSSSSFGSGGEKQQQRQEDDSAAAADDDKLSKSVQTILPNRGTRKPTDILVNSGWEDTLKWWSIITIETRTPPPQLVYAAHRVYMIGAFLKECNVPDDKIEVFTNPCSIFSLLYSTAITFATDPPNPKEAVKWLYKAAIAGHVRAQYQLALCLHQGRGVECNLTTAVKWYLRAAEGGNTRAMYNTSLCYSSSEGLVRSHRQARKWMKRAADHGHTKHKSISSNSMIPHLCEAFHQTELLDELPLHVVSIAIAEVFHSIGALTHLLHKLADQSAGIRAKATKAISDMVQNNPTSQQLVMEAGGKKMILANFLGAIDPTFETISLDAISSLFSSKEPCISAFGLEGYQFLKAMLDINSLSTPCSQRKALDLIARLVVEHKPDYKILTELEYLRIIMRLVDSDDAEVRKAALKCLTKLALAEIAVNSGQMVKIGDLIKKCLQDTINQMIALAPPVQALISDEMRLLDLLWFACYNEPSSLQASGLVGCCG